MPGVQHIIDHDTAKVRPLRHKIVNGVLSVDGSASTQPISATALPLPAGAATSAAQATNAGHLNTIQACVAGNKLAVSIADTVTTTQGVLKDQASLNASSSVTAGDFSAVHNVSDYNKATVVGTHTGNDNVEVHISQDDTNYYKLAGLSGGYPDSDAAFSFTFDAPFKYYKLKYKGSGTVTALGFAQA
tara:strand:- start:292 stop:855 length:564 start_codon:yes stop_codon:yes gene_type:complete